MTTRADVVRNREKVLAAAATMRDRGQALQLNAVAREADVGVGTVYRHFANVTELVEALVLDRFTDLEARAREITDVAGLRQFLAYALDILVSDADFAEVATSLHPALAETAAARKALVESLSMGISAAQTDAAADTSLRPTDILVLLCGLAYAVRRSSATSERTQQYLEAFFHGVFPASNK